MQEVTRGYSCLTIGSIALHHPAYNRYCDVLAGKLPELSPLVPYISLFSLFTILCVSVEATRVRLPVDDRSGRGDYINANYLSVGIRPAGKEYISTQGPLPETVIDFWRMVLHTRSNVIVMVTPLQEGGKACVGVCNCSCCCFLFVIRFLFALRAYPFLYCPYRRNVSSTGLTSSNNRPTVPQMVGFIHCLLRPASSN